MLNLLPVLHSEFFLECNTSCFKAGGNSILPLSLVDDLFAAYCCIDFISEI